MILTGPLGKRNAASSLQGRKDKPGLLSAPPDAAIETLNAIYRPGDRTDALVVKSVTALAAAVVAPARAGS